MDIPKLKTKTDELYLEAMGPQATKRQLEASARRCNCALSDNSKPYWQHYPGCRFQSGLAAKRLRRG